MEIGQEAAVLVVWCMCLIYVIHRLMLSYKTTSCGGCSSHTVSKKKSPLVVLGGSLQKGVQIVRQHEKKEHYSVSIQK